MAVLVEEAVLGLQIAMDDTLGMQVLDGIEQFPRIPPCQARVRPHHLVLRPQRAPQITIGVVQLLQKVQVVVVLEGVVEGDDVTSAGIVIGAITGAIKGRGQPILQHPSLHLHLVVDVGMLPLGQLLDLLLLDDLERKSLGGDLVGADDDPAEIALPDLGVEGELPDGGGAGFDGEVLRGWLLSGIGAIGSSIVAPLLGFALSGQGHLLGVAEQTFELLALSLEGVASGHLLILIRRQRGLAIGIGIAITSTLSTAGIRISLPRVLSNILLQPIQPLQCVLGRPYGILPQPQLDLGLGQPERGLGVMMMMMMAIPTLVRRPTAGAGMTASVGILLLGNGGQLDGLGGIDQRLVVPLHPVQARGAVAQVHYEGGRWLCWWLCPVTLLCTTIAA
mmetsp:Transcript_31028/g.90766  ORF Transcript_31028/g.90766 Transcript_31028/m.90766 type:complete len:392 (-) Transcript_31028:43-1218(-)